MKPIIKKVSIIAGVILAIGCLTYLCSKYVNNTIIIISIFALSFLGQIIIDELNLYEGRKSNYIFFQIGIYVIATYFIVLPQKETMNLFSTQMLLIILIADAISFICTIIYVLIHNYFRQKKYPHYCLFDKETLEYLGCVDTNIKSFDMYEKILIIKKVKKRKCKHCSKKILTILKERKNPNDRVK